MTTYRKMLDEFLAADKQDVADFTDQHAWSPPSIETRLAFTEFRLRKIGSAFAALLAMLADDEERRARDGGEAP